MTDASAVHNQNYKPRAFQRENFSKISFQPLVLRFDIKTFLTGIILISKTIDILCSWVIPFYLNNSLSILVD